MTPEERRKDDGRRLALWSLALGSVMAGAAMLGRRLGTSPFRFFKSYGDAAATGGAVGVALAFPSFATLRLVEAQAEAIGRAVGTAIGTGLTGGGK